MNGDTDLRSVEKAFVRIKVEGVVLFRVTRRGNLKSIGHLLRALGAFYLRIVQSWALSGQYFEGDNVFGRTNLQLCALHPVTLIAF